MPQKLTQKKYTIIYIDIPCFHLQIENDCNDSDSDWKEIVHIVSRTLTKPKMTAKPKMFGGIGRESSTMSCCPNFNRKALPFSNQFHFH